jgi:hypothetical protein
LGAILGVLWCGALLIPDWTGDALILGDRSPWRMFILLVAASALLSLVLPARRLAKRWWGLILTGLAAPIVGCVVYAEMVLFVDLVVTMPSTDLSGNPEGPLAALIGLVVGVVYLALLGAPVVAYVAYTQAISVALPMGFVHVIVLSRFTGDRLITRGDGRPGGVLVGGSG